MSRLDYDDPDDDDRPSANVPFPRGAKIAGIIWMSFGAIGVLLGILSFIASNGVESGGCCGVIISLALAIIGEQAFNGKAMCLLSSGIGSIIFGLIFGVGSIAVIALNQQVEWIAVGASITIFSMALLVAGYLALTSRSDYERWRRAKGLASRPRPRPRALTDEERDYDDEYRP